MSVYKSTLFLATWACVISSCVFPRGDLPLYSQNVAQVDDKVIKEDTLRLKLKLEIEKNPSFNLKKIKGQPIAANPELKEIANTTLNRLIEEFAIISFGEKQGITLSDEEVEKKFTEEKQKKGSKAIEDLLVKYDISPTRWKTLKENEIRASHVRETLLLKELKVSLNEIKSYYAAHLEDFDVKERVRVRHIVTDSEEKAKDIHSRILKGENFAKLAIDHSISPERARGGDLGYFSRGNFPKVFDDTCFNLKKGEISPVVKSDYGYHIFKLIDKKPAGKKDWEEVSAQIQQKLFEEKLKKIYDPWLGTVLKKAKVVVHQDILDKFVL